MHATNLPEARTKIVATLGPASCSPEVIERLMRCGADVFRLNMAHGSLEDHARTVADVRRVSHELERPVGILVDLAGPKIRLGELFCDPLECAAGDELELVRGDVAQSARQLVSNYPPLVDELDLGDRLLLADGTVALEVTSKQADAVQCRVTEAGTLRGKQGINAPHVKLSVGALTDADRRHVAWAAAQDIDFVSLSFVRRKQDVQQLRELLDAHGCRVPVIAKIEKPEALENLAAIAQESDGIMVARGDLGVEIDVAKTPVAQKRIIETCQRFCKPVIVATQMLDSMQTSRRPTRAEVSDVANAILDGADACMLSGETAIGQFPVESVEMMNRVMVATEDLLRDRPLMEPARAEVAGVHPVTQAVIHAAGRIARQVGAKLVVVASHSGATARAKAKHRGFIRTIGVSDDPLTLRRMNLYWGIQPLPKAPLKSGPELRKFVEHWGRQQRLVADGDRIVFVMGSALVAHAHNLIVVHEVEPHRAEDGPATDRSVMESLP